MLLQERSTERGALALKWPRMLLLEGSARREVLFRKHPSMPLQERSTERGALALELLHERTVKRGVLL